MRYDPAMERRTYEIRIKLPGRRRLVLGFNPAERIARADAVYLAAAEAGIPFPTWRQVVAFANVAAAGTMALAIAGAITFGPLGLAVGALVGTVLSMWAERDLYK